MNQHPRTEDGAIEPLVSDFADDTDMVDLIEFFVSEMSDRIQTLHEAWEQSRMEDVRTIAHQLKGAGAGYGFQPVTTAAGTLEDAIVSGPSDADALQAKFEELLQMCHRVAANSA